MLISSTFLSLLKNKARVLKHWMSVLILALWNFFIMTPLFFLALCGMLVWGLVLFLLVATANIIGFLVALTIYLFSRKSCETSMEGLSTRNMRKTRKRAKQRNPENLGNWML